MWHAEVSCSDGANFSKELLEGRKHILRLCFRYGYVIYNHACSQLGTFWKRLCSYVNLSIEVVHFVYSPGDPIFK